MRVTLICPLLRWEIGSLGGARFRSCHVWPRFRSWDPGDSTWDPRDTRGPRDHTPRGPRVGLPGPSELVGWLLLNKREGSALEDSHMGFLNGSGLHGANVSLYADVLCDGGELGTQPRGG